MITRHNFEGLSYLKSDGEGIPLLLLHGISSDAETFRAMMEAMPNPCFAFDMAGYGGSKSVENMSEYLQKLASFIANKDIHVLGSSLGSIVAVRLAAISSNVKALHLVGAALGYGLKAGETPPESVTARLEGLKNETPQEFANKRAPRLIHQPERKPEVLANVTRAMAGLRLEGLIPASNLLNEADLLKESAKLNIPFHIYVGEGDVIAPPENARKLAMAVGENLQTFKIIKDAGHALVQEQPDFLRGEI
jgi:pimeloyl-ACP methyl ester carboxylesterase